MDDDAHYASLFDTLEQDRKDQKVYCDVTVSVNNKHFSAHRCVLGTFCVYFATLFQSGFKEKYDDVIKLSGPIGEEISPSTFQSILDFCYKKRCELTASNVFDILGAAEFLQIDRLKQQCLQYLETLIGPEHWQKIYKTAIR